MTRTRHAIYASLLLLATTFSGCASSPHSSHEGNLLDNKVTAQRMNAALRKAGGDFNHVEVQATRKGITLTGTVKSPEAKGRAEEIVKSVNRPAELANELKVSK